jgi:hypothetical protein
MMHPTDPVRRPRGFNDLPDGVDEPAEIGSTWKP